MNISSIMLEGDIDYELNVSSVCSEYVEFELLLFSERFAQVDAVFEYKPSGGAAWRSDAILMASCVDGNKLLKLSCGSTGSIKVFRWFYSRNNMARGDNCEVRLQIAPTINVLLDSNGYTNSEIISAIGSHAESSPISYKVVNFGFDRHRLCITDTQFIVLSNLGDSILTVSLPNIVWAQEKRDGNFIVLRSNGHLLEISSSGLVTRDVSTGLSNVSYFVFDELTTNVLVAGTIFGSGIVVEYTWGGNYDTTPHWTSSSINLLSPAGVSYCPDRSRIVVVDRGNPPSTDSSLVTINLDTKSYTVTSSVNIREIDLKFYHPFIPFVMDDGTVVVVEDSGESQVYNVDMNSHSSLVRAGIGSGSGKDTLPEYKGLVFASLVRSQE
jgi:hypothetical protein